MKTLCTMFTVRSLSNALDLELAGTVGYIESDSWCFFCCCQSVKRADSNPRLFFFAKVRSFPTSWKTSTMQKPSAKRKSQPWRIRRRNCKANSLRSFMTPGTSSFFENSLFFFCKSRLSCDAGKSFFVVL